MNDVNCYRGCEVKMKKTPRFRVREVFGKAGKTAAAL
jgi:hypothetical protein